MAQSIYFNWDASPSPEVDYYRLYEDGVLVADKIGVLNFNLLMDGKEEKTFSYHVTAVAENAGGNIESAPSNTVTYDFFVVAPPTGLRVSGVPSAS